MDSQHQAKTCTCNTSTRNLVLLTARLGESFPELLQFAKYANWTYYPELDALEIQIGGEPPMSSLSDLVNFLRGLLDESRLNSLRAVWTTPQKPLIEQLVTLIHAGPLVGMAQHNTSELLDILYKKRIETWFQPIFSTATQKLWGYECLLRAKDQNNQFISPLQLITWAKQENLIFMLDRMCRETHLLNAGAKLSNLAHINICVNFLPSSIYRPEFCLRSTAAAAQKAGLHPSQVIFEVIETEAISDSIHLKGVFEHYRKIGFKVALDDVGSGFSSLQLLADLGPDLLKIDGKLVRTARESALNKHIIAALVEMGKKSGKLVLAEGIETANDHDLIMSFGVDLVQGYYYGRPSPNAVESETMPNSLMA